MIGNDKNSDSGQHPVLAVTAALAVLLMGSTAVIAAPAIRTSDKNRVPACATPERLTAFLGDRNPAVSPRYRDIARWYKYWGEAWRVRWDYAFFQMILETNALRYRRDDGSPGDVNEMQNNFAGIGATGGGVPGDRFPDIKTGVHAQIQHLVAYSGERLAAPIAPRTQMKQDDIVEQSRRLRRPVTFADLARRWASDRAYAKSIDALAQQFGNRYCNNVAAGGASTPLAVPQPILRRGLGGFAQPSGLGGPKPLRLAGPPEQLPWLNPDTQQPVPQQEPAPAANQNRHEPAQPHERSPVRTIWSREGAGKPTANELAPTRRTAAVPPPSTKTAAQTVTPQPAPSAAEPAKDDDTPLLPHFKIAPVVPEPSRLGGPVDALPIAASANASAHFKDVVTMPPKAGAVSSNADGACRVLTASYGGKKTLLVRANINGEMRYTALTVLEGFEKSMFDIYARAFAPGAEVVGEYPTKDEALADARTNCPNGSN